jgi:hypothetical protein
VSGFTLRKLALADMDAAATVHRAAFDAALPWLAGLHTPEEDRGFFRERVLVEQADGARDEEEEPDAPYLLVAEP